jgi:hypothetical protein
MASEVVLNLVEKVGFEPVVGLSVTGEEPRQPARVICKRGNFVTRPRIVLVILNLHIALRDIPATRSAESKRNAWRLS